MIDPKEVYAILGENPKCTYTILRCDEKELFLSMKGSISTEQLQKLAEKYTITSNHPILDANEVQWPQQEWIIQFKRRKS